MSPSERNAKWRKKNPQKVQEYNRRSRCARYGLTVEEYDALLESQGGGCAVCGEAPGGRFLSVDHDHATGRVRGLLCHYCNPGLGNFRDSEALLRRAITYLKRFS